MNRDRRQPRKFAPTVGIELEERIAPSSANFPPGQFPAGNPAHAPGNSNPNEHPSDNQDKRDK